MHNDEHDGFGPAVSDTSIVGTSSRRRGLVAVLALGVAALVGGGLWATSGSDSDTAAVATTTTIDEPGETQPSDPDGYSTSTTVATPSSSQPPTPSTTMVNRDGLGLSPVPATWSEKPAPDGLNQIDAAYTAGDTVYLVSDHLLFSSNDFETWREHEIGLDDSTLEGLGLGFADATTVKITSVVASSDVIAVVARLDVSEQRVDGCWDDWLIEPEVVVASRDGGNSWVATALTDPGAVGGRFYSLDESATVATDGESLLAAAPSRVLLVDTRCVLAENGYDASAGFPRLVEGGIEIVSYGDEGETSEVVAFDDLDLTELELTTLQRELEHSDPSSPLLEIEPDGSVVELEQTGHRIAHSGDAFFAQDNFFADRTIRSETGGRVWTRPPIGPDLDLASDSQLLVGGIGNRIEMSTDGGGSWAAFGFPQSLMPDSASYDEGRFLLASRDPGGARADMFEVEFFIQKDDLTLGFLVSDDDLSVTITDSEGVVVFDASSSDPEEFEDLIVERGDSADFLDDEGRIIASITAEELNEAMLENLEEREGTGSAQVVSFSVGGLEWWHQDAESLVGSGQIVHAAFRDNRMLLVAEEGGDTKLYLGVLADG